MADTTPNQTVDNMNRQVDVMSYGPDAQSFIKGMMMGDVTQKGKPPGHTEKEDKGQYKKLEKVLGDIEESFSGILKDAEKSAKKIGEIYKKLSGSKAAPSGGKTKANIKAEFDGDDAEEGIEKLGDSAEGFGSRVTESIGKISPATQEAAWHLRFLFNKVGQTMQKATSMMVGGIAAVTGGLTLGHVFEGVVGPTIQFERSMRRTLHQTQGVGKSVVFMQEELTKVGDTVKFTGRMRHKFLKAYDTNMKKGIRTQKETLKITRTGLGLANLIGDSTDSTASSMHDWSMQTGMTTQQVGALSYKIRDVAKMTGVTGENLANVVKQSSAMVQNFRNAGSFSSTIAGNIVAMNAAASKYGAEDYVTEFQKGLSGIDGWSDSSMKSLLAIGATASGMKFSVMDMPALLEDPAKTKKLLAGMESTMMGIKGSGNTFAEGNKLAAKSLEEITSGDYKKRMRAMSEANPASGAIEGFAVLDRKMKGISGKTIGENAAGLTALKESFQTVGERMFALNEKYKGNLSIEEARLHKEKQLETVLGSQLTTMSDIGASQNPFEEIANKLGKMDEASLKHLGVSDQLISQAAKEGQSIQDLFANPKSDASMEAMGGVMQSMASNIMQKMKSADMSASEIEEFGLDAKSVEKAMSGDRGGMMDFMDKAQAAEQAAATKLQAKADPISDMAQTMMEVNDKMGQLVQNSSNWFMRVFGKLGIIALILGGAVAGIVKGFGVVGLTSWIPGIKQAVGRGGADAAKMRGVASGLQGIPGKITRAITGTNVKIGGQIIPNALGGGRQAAGASKMVGGLAGKLKSLGGGKSLITKIPGVGKALTSVGTRLAGMGAAAGSAGGTAGLGAVLTPLKAIPGIGLAITAALGGVIGAFSTGAAAADLYGTTQEQLTFNQKYAAEEAGFLTGALNMLSFGVFAKWLGPGGTWTKGLATFFAALGPLRYVLMMTLIPIRLLINALKVTWGVIKGIGVFIAEVFKGIWAGIKIAFSPFVELGEFIMEIGSSIAGMLGQNAEGPSLLSKIGDVTEWIVAAFRKLGQVVGFVGKAIGWLIKMALMPFLLMAKFLMAVLGGVIKGIILFTKAILKPFQAVWKSIKGIFSSIIEPFISIWDSIKEVFGAITGLFSSGEKSGSMFMAVMDGIAWVFGFLGKIVGWVLKVVLWPLVTVFKLIGFAIKVVLTPIMVLAKFISNIAKIIKGELKLSELFKGIGDILMKIPLMIWGAVKNIGGYMLKIPGMLLSGLLKVPGLILDGFISVFVDLPTYLWEGFKGGLQKVWDWILTWIPGGKGFSETAEESSVRIAEEGNSLVQGAGRSAGGLADLVTGGGEGRIAGLKKMAGGAIEAGKALIGKLNPFSWFSSAVGTPKLSKGGLAMVHAGEMIVPAGTPMADGKTGFGPSIMNTMTGGKIAGDMGAAAPDKLGPALKTAQGKVGELAAKVKSMVPPTIQKDIGKIGGALKHVFKSVKAGEFAKAGKILKTIPGHMKNMIPKSFQKSIGEVGGALKDKLGKALKYSQGKVGEWAAKAKSMLPASVQKNIGKIGGAFKHVFKSVKAGEFAKAGKILKTIPGHMMKMLPTSVQKNIGKIGGYMKNMIPKSIQKAVGDVGGALKNKLGKALKYSQGKVGEWAAKAKSMLPASVQKNIGKIGGAFKHAFKSVKAGELAKAGKILKTIPGHMMKMLPTSVQKNIGKIGGYMKNMIPKSIQKAAGDVGGALKNKLGKSLKYAQGKIGQLSSKAMKMLPASVQKNIGKIGGALKHTFKAIKVGELEKAGKILKTIPGHMKNMVPSGVQKNIGKVAGVMKDKIGPGMKVLSKAAGEGSGKLSSAANALKGMGKHALDAGSKLATKAGPELSKLATKAGPAIAKASGTIVKGAGTVAKVAGGAVAKGMGKAAGMVAGKAAGPFALAVGGAFGAAEAEALGMTKGEGAMLGALTGGADTGSMFSGMLGIEKDSAADKALGVAGAAGTGAMTGAAIGSFVPVIGTAVGAAIGGVVGAGAEVYKIFKGPIDNFVGGTLDAMGPVGDGIRAVGGVISGAAGGIGSAIGDVAGGIWDAGGALLSGDIVGAVGSLAGGLWDAGGSLLGGIGDMIGSVAEGAMNIGSSLLDGAGAIGGMAWDAAAAVGGKFADAGSKLMEGDVLGAAGDVATAGWEGMKSVGSSVAGWLGFAEGTPEVQSGGLAMLHPGEMIIPANMDVAGAALGGVGKALEGSIGGSKIATGIGSLLSSGFGMIRSTVEAVAEGAPDGFSGIAKSVSKNAGGGLLGGVLGGAAGGAMFGPLGMLAGAAGGAMFGDGGLTDSIKAMVGDESTAANAVMPTADIHDRVQRDIAVSRSSTSVGGKDLSMISSSTDQQCATLVEIRDHLKAMRDNMGQTDTSSGHSSPTAGGGDTSSNIQPKSSPEYYTWQFGQHGQIGNKQVINPGT